MAPPRNIDLILLKCLENAMCVRAILLLIDPINCSVVSANKGGARAPRAPPLLLCYLTHVICYVTLHNTVMLHNTVRKLP